MKKVGLLVLLVLSRTAFADTLILASGEFPPFTGESLPDGGVTSKIVSDAFREMGHQVETHFLPWRRGFVKTLEGDYFGTFAYSMNEQRKKDWHFSVPLYHLKEVFFVLKGSGVRYRSDNDLIGKIICKPQGYNKFRLAQLVEQGMLYVESPRKMKSCFSMLERQRVNMVMTNPETGWRFIRELFENQDDFNVLEKPFIEITHHLIVPKSAVNGLSILKQFNLVILEHQRKGIIGRLLEGGVY